MASFEDIERAGLYRLFAGIFMKEPTEEMLVHIKDMFQMRFDDSPQEIQMDFIRIFSGTGEKLAPYESLYNYPLGDRPRLWGKAAEEVLGFYNSTGLTIDEEMPLIPDHISAELLFMSYLIENGLMEHQRRFSEEHLIKWIPEYCEEVSKQAKTTFYKELSGILKDFILYDHENLGYEA
ncbi:MAG: molecular chaperone TorD family protein [Thermodesulfovibrionales bacterium]